MDLALLYKISPRIANLTLTSEPDSFHWSLTQNGIFSVRSHYQALSQVEPQDTNRKLWKIIAPLKVKVFLRYLHRGVLLTKDNLAKRNWQGNRACCFYLHEETIQHLFFIVGLLEQSGPSFIVLLAYLNLLTPLICLGHGWRGLLPSCSPSPCWARRQFVGHCG